MVEFIDVEGKEAPSDYAYLLCGLSSSQTLLNEKYVDQVAIVQFDLHLACQGCHFLNSKETIDNDNQNDQKLEECLTLNWSLGGMTSETSALAKVCKNSAELSINNGGSELDQCFVLDSIDRESEMHHLVVNSGTNSKPSNSICSEGLPSFLLEKDKSIEIPLALQDSRSTCLEPQLVHDNASKEVMREIESLLSYCEECTNSMLNIDQIEVDKQHTTQLKDLSLVLDRLSSTLKSLSNQDPELAISLCFETILPTSEMTIYMINTANQIVELITDRDLKKKLQVKCQNTQMRWVTNCLLTSEDAFDPYGWQQMRNSSMKSIMEDALHVCLVLLFYRNWNSFKDNKYSLPPLIFFSIKEFTYACCTSHLASSRT